MGKRDPKHVQRRHGERFSALKDHMNQGLYHHALEDMHRILGDRRLPPEIRLDVTLRQSEALLALGLNTEAWVSAEHAETIMKRHGLWHLRSQVSRIIDRVRSARDEDTAS